MIRVLITDDHEVVRRGVRDILITRLDRSTVVVEAKDAGEAINQLIESEWNLVIVDINLPGRSGLEVLEEARRLRPETPVLVLTYYPEEEFALRSFGLGAAGYLTKQGASDELITAVRRVLAGGRYVTSSLAERLALSFGAIAEQEPHETLSHRERQILRLVAVGKSTKEIADELALSEKTVATYRTRISEKTGLTTNVKIARYALKRGLVD